MHYPKGLAAAVCFALLLASGAAPQSPPPQPPPTFARDIAPILYRSCVSCHRPGESAPFSLLDYDDAKANAPLIAAATRARVMPPWLPEAGYGDFANDPRLTDAEIRLIDAWLNAGAPEGPPADVPPLPHFTEGWQLGPPDMTLDATRAFTVPSSGPDVFWNFIFSPQVTEKRYVRAIEVRPGIPHAVHHANVLVDPTRSARKQEAEPGAGFPGMDLRIEHSTFDFDTHFLFWKPGGAPWVEPDGLAWELDPGADLVLNAHLMPMGMPMQVKPSIGLYFTDKPPTKFPLLIELEHDSALDIPPGVRDFPVADDFRLPVDVDILAVYPHAHFLGHALEAYATLPNGRRKWLIRIPQWDPNWQAVYHYREPVFLPKGAVISMRWRFDNSTANPRNPHHPPQRVIGGNQSTDEMAHLWFQLLPHGTGDQRPVIEEAMVRHRVERDPDDYSAHLWLGALMLSRFDPGDALEQLEDAVRVDPKQAEGHNWLGIALSGEGRLREAIEQFQAALAIQPDYTNARYRLAKALAKSGQLEDASRTFEQLINEAPNDAQVRNDFGELLLQMHTPAEALAQFDKALSLDPTLKTAQDNRDEARRDLEDLNVGPRP